MKPPLRHLVVVSLMIGTFASPALVITDYNATQFDRFASGYPTAPVPNTSAQFIGAGYDWSGVGWDAGLATRNIALISDRYFVYAGHYTPGSILDFFSPTLYAANPGNPAAAIVSYTWSGTSYGFTDPLDNTKTSDLRVGRLDNSVNAAQGLATYPILDLPSLNNYLNLPLLVYGHGGSSANSPRIGTDTLDSIVYASNLYTIAAAYNFTSQTGSAYLQSGDSGGPLFVPWAGGLALVGTHLGISTTPPVSASSFIPAYLDQMASAGIDFSVVPEPGPLTMLTPLVGVALLAVALKRHFRQSRGTT